MRVLNIEKGTGIKEVLLRLLIYGLKKNSIRIIEIFEKNAWNLISDLRMKCVAMPNYENRTANCTLR